MTGSSVYYANWVFFPPATFPHFVVCSPDIHGCVFMNLSRGLDYQVALPETVEGVRCDEVKKGPSVGVLARWFTSACPSPHVTCPKSP